METGSDGQKERHTHGCWGWRRSAGLETDGEVSKCRDRIREGWDGDRDSEVTRGRQSDTGGLCSTVALVLL